MSQILREEFQGYGLPQHEIISSIDFTHPALPQQRDNAIPPGDALSRFETTM